MIEFHIDQLFSERRMGGVARSVTSCIYPFSQLANTLMQREQFKVMRMRYLDLSETLDYSGQRCDWNEVSRTERYFPEINDRVVLWTLHGSYKLTSTEKVAIAVYFQNARRLSHSRHVGARIRIRGRR